MVRFVVCYSAVLNVASVTGIIPSTPESCRNEIGNCLPADSICSEPFEPIVLILTDLSIGIAQADILDIAMIANISDHNSSSTPERVWMLDTVETGSDTNITRLYDLGITTRLYDHGIHFTPGYQLSGLVTLSERRIIQSYFSDMWGFQPVCVLLCNLF